MSQLETYDVNSKSVLAHNKKIHFDSQALKDGLRPMTVENRGAKTRFKQNRLVEILDLNPATAANIDDNPISIMD